MNLKTTINFIKELYQEEGFIPLHVPVFRGNEKKYLNEMIDSTFVSSVGPFVDKFENVFSDIIKVEGAVAVVNGTSALQVALELAGVRNGDEVLTQALTFVATANAISYNNAIPVFIDVDLNSMGLSPIHLSSFLEEHAEIREDGTYNKFSGRRIGACVPMHTFGFMADISDILIVCKKWGIPVIEDAAEALGSSFIDQPAGSFGQISAFSFNGNKIVTAGGGGAIVSNDKNHLKKAKHVTTTAKVPHTWEYDHDVRGYNFRMPNINAALICAQLEMLPEYIKNKKSTAHQYHEFFQRNGIKFRIEERENYIANYWLMCVELESKRDRDLFLNETNNNGVMTRPIWKLMYKLPMYEHCQRDKQENAEFLEDRIVNIPSSVI